ncbi:MAG TPA: hypothetical protein VK203_28800 [Nostocaceae cyanobacterium]|nr:hypothetical protein [Nostocaceae cyanobacterium]
MLVTNPKLALGIFDSTKDLEQAINQLQADEFPLEKVSVIGKDIQQERIPAAAQVKDKIGNQNVDATGAVGDTLTATTWGSVLVGLSSLAIPSLGAILAAGSLGVALITSIAGVAVGVTANQNLINALVNLGIPEEKARVYSDALQQSYYLLIVEGEERDIQQVEEILKGQKIRNWGVFDSALQGSEG